MASNLLRVVRHATNGGSASSSSSSHPTLTLCAVRDLKPHKDLKAIAVEVLNGDVSRRTFFHRLTKDNEMIQLSETFRVNATCPTYVSLIGKCGKTDRVLGRSDKISKSGFYSMKIHDATGLPIAFVDLNKSVESVKDELEF